MHPSQLAINALLEQCEIRRQRRSGPGGQHRNKVETGIFIVHQPTGIEAAATEKRSQARNRETAIQRLRVKLAIEFRSSEPPDQTKEQSSDATPRETSALWQIRSKGGRIKINPNHEDFPAILAEALNAISESDFGISAAANSLSCSSSQLTKLLSIEPAALTWVNRQRETLGLKPLARR